MHSSLVLYLVLRVWLNICREGLGHAGRLLLAPDGPKHTPPPQVVRAIPGRRAQNGRPHVRSRAARCACLGACADEGWRHLRQRGDRLPRLLRGPFVLRGQCV